MLLTPVRKLSCCPKSESTISICDPGQNLFILSKSLLAETGICPQEDEIYWQIPLLWISGGYLPIKKFLYWQIPSRYPKKGICQYTLPIYSVWPGSTLRNGSVYYTPPFRNVDPGQKIVFPGQNWSSQDIGPGQKFVISICQKYSCQDFDVTNKLKETATMLCFQLCL